MKTHMFRRILVVFAIFYLLSALLPLLAFCTVGSEKKHEAAPPPAPAGAVFRLRDHDGSVLEVDETEFVMGGIAAEVPPTYPAEALKAQGVALYTYYSRLREQSRSEGKDADFSCNTKTGMVYLPKETRRSRWGDCFEKWEKSLQKAEKSIRGKTLRSSGALLCSTYFAISSGITDDAADVWGGDYSYLKPAASPGDIFSGGYLSHASLTQEEARRLILKEFPDLTPEGSPDKWITKVERTGSGTIRKANLCGKEVTGTHLRTVFGLRSANFTWKIKNKQLLFTVKGWGHNVGMSQSGACYMAENGASYQQILSWYYPGSTLV